MEVLIPVVFSKTDVLKKGIIDFGLIRKTAENTFNTAAGIFSDEWINICFPKDKVQKRRDLKRFARILIAGHLFISVLCFYSGIWQIPLLTSFSFIFGRWLHLLCNQTQHIGFSADLTDYRLNSRTFLMNPILEFLYWNMNYHLEHHMFASIPCYNLKKLHYLIHDDLPKTTKGIYKTWKEIFTILEQKEENPDFVFLPELPEKH